MKVINDWKSHQFIDESVDLSPAVSNLSEFIYSNPVIGNLTINMINSWNEIITNPDTPELNCNITTSQNKKLYVILLQLMIF